MIFQMKIPYFIKYGNIPDIKYYDIDIETYKALSVTHNKSDWSFKEESLLYLEKDLYSLYEVLKKANKKFFLLFNIQMTDSLTITSLALKVFMKDHYPTPVIPLIKNNKIYSDIKKAYYGGITEVYKPYGEKLHYYDVNGLYPYVSLQDMPGTQCIKKEFINKDVDIDNLFGFFYCEIETNNNDYLGLLPVRDQSGLIFPLGKWRGWYFSEQLKCAKNNSYKIKVIKGYEFNRQSNVFSSYVEKLHQLKSNAENTAEIHIYKLLLNSLLGRFGLNLVKTVTKLVDRKTFDKIQTTRILTCLPKHMHDSILVSYIPGINKKLCDTLGIDVLKVRDSELDSKDSNIIDIENTFPGVSVAISAAVTAYGRVYMCKLKILILKLGGKIYYSDTDSIVTDLDLEHIIPNRIDSKELGKLKKEYYVEKGYFISGKTYCLIADIIKKGAIIKKGVVIKKAKGINSSGLELNDYIKMLRGESLNTGKKTTAIKNFEDGSVTIFKKDDIVLNTEGYTRREKVFDMHDKNKWIDTKPWKIPHDNLKDDLSTLEDDKPPNLEIHN